MAKAARALSHLYARPRWHTIFLDDHFQKKVWSKWCIATAKRGKLVYTKQGGPRMSKQVEDEDFEAIQQALKIADELVTCVTGGRPGTQAKALEYARVIDGLKRRKFLANR